MSAHRGLILSRSLLAGAAWAEDYTIGSIRIENPWTRATPKGADIAGAYMIISNKGTASDRLIGGSTPVAGRFEFHRMLTEQGVMKMRPVKDGLELKPDAVLEISPLYATSAEQLKQRNVVGSLPRVEDGASVYLG